LKLEKISSFSKDNKINLLEELVLKIGYDPSNVKAGLDQESTDATSRRKISGYGPRGEKVFQQDRGSTKEGSSWFEGDK
jgi:hypothetical protein